MAYRFTPKLIYPLGDFKDISLAFGSESFYDKKFWGIHLGIDINAKAETKVFSIGRGTVVYSKIHLGEISPNGNNGAKTLKRNWGGIVIIAHKNPRTREIFYSLYGHLGKRFVKKGDAIEAGEMIGTIGNSMTESNGYWEKEHLHFAIYTGPYHGKVLPGYYKEESDLTKLHCWRNPMEFIKNYHPKINFQ